MGRKIHWEICRKIGFDVNEKWYKHELKESSGK